MVSKHGGTGNNYCNNLVDVMWVSRPNSRSLITLASADADASAGGIDTAPILDRLLRYNHTGSYHGFP